MTSAPASNSRIDTAAPPRLALLDALRFAAAAGVLLYHFTARRHDSWGRDPAEVFPALHELGAVGAFGVDLFFIISGFVILMSAWGRPVPKFVASRMARLLPAYIAGVVLTSFLLVVLWPERKPLSLNQILANFTMAQAAFGIPHVDGVYWTLWTELRFYLLIGIFLLIGITTQRAVAFAAIWPTLAMFARQNEADFVASLLIAEDAALFAGGMMLYVISRNPRSLVAWIVLVQNVLLAAAWAGPQTARSISNNTGLDARPAVAAAVIVACFAAVALVSLTGLSKINWKVLTALGALTYPLYLIHEYWGWWFISLLHDVMSPYVVLICATLLCLLLAWLINRFVEKPFGPRLKAAVESSIAALAPTRVAEVSTTGHRDRT